MKLYPLSKTQRKLERAYLEKLHRERVYEDPVPIPQIKPQLTGKFIDVVCTAVKRPYIVDATFKSFREKLFKKHKCRLIINVDPVGDNINPSVIVKIGENYFDEVCANTPTEPSFPKAFKWCFSQVQARHVFHLQDDWALLSHHDLNEMIGLLDTFDFLACVRLEAARTKFITKLTDKINVSGRYYDHPALWKSEFYQGIMPFFSEEVGTEYQIRGDYPPNRNEMLNAIKKWSFGVYNEAKSIQDIGRGWLDSSKWRPVYGNADNKRMMYLTKWVSR